VYVEGRNESNHLLLNISTELMRKIMYTFQFYRDKTHFVQKLKI